MKFKNSAIIFSLILMFSIFNFPFASAYSPFPPSCIEGQSWDFVNNECRGPENIGEIEQPGAIGGFFGKLKMAFSNPETKAKLSAVLTAEQIAHLENSLAEGNYKEALGAAEDIRRTIGNSGGYLEEYGKGTPLEYDEVFNKGPYTDYRYVEGMWITNLARMNEMSSEINSFHILSASS